MTDAEWRERITREITERPRLDDVRQYFTEAERRAIAHCDGNRASQQRNHEMELARLLGMVEALRATVYGEDGVNGMGADIRDTRHDMASMRRMARWSLALLVSLVLSGLVGVVFGIVQIRLALP